MTLRKSGVLCLMLNATTLSSLHVIKSDLYIKVLLEWEKTQCIKLE